MGVLSGICVIASIRVGGGEGLPGNGGGDHASCILPVPLSFCTVHTLRNGYGANRPENAREPGIGMGIIMRCIRMDT